MYNKKQLVILIIAGIILFLAGMVLGMIYQANNTVQITKNQAINTLSSKVVSSINAYGTVAKIEGRNITLSNLGENLLISVADSARVYSFTVSDKTSAPTQQAVSFGDIKIGDNVNVVLKLLPSGQTQGSSVVILPK